MKNCALLKLGLSLALVLASLRTMGGSNEDLLAACGKQDLTGMKAALAAGADVNYVDPKSSANALVSSVFLANAEMVQLLLDNKANPNVRYSPLELTPLMAATARQHLGVVKLLLTAGADVHARTKQDVPVLGMLLSTAVHTDILKAVLDAGAKSDVNAQILLPGLKKKGSLMSWYATSAKTPDESVAMMQAALPYFEKNGWPVPDYYRDAAAANYSPLKEVTALLIQAGADPNSVDAASTPCIIPAIQLKRVGIVEGLLDAGVSPNTKVTSTGAVITHAFTTACNAGNVPVAEMLLKKGADINAREYYNGYYVNGLMLAAGNGDDAMVKFLLANDAEVNARAKKKEYKSEATYSYTLTTTTTALSGATDQQHPETAKLLVAAGAKGPKELKNYVDRAFSEK